MWNICFYAMFFVIFLQFTFGAIRYSGVNRTFLSMYKGVFETSLITVGSDGEPIYPYFGEEVLRQNIDSYLLKNITNYVKKYDTQITYLNLLDGGMCLEENCSKVRIVLMADINVFFQYSRSLEYYVKVGDINE